MTTTTQDIFTRLEAGEISATQAKHYLARLMQSLNERKADGYTTFTYNDGIDHAIRLIQIWIGKEDGE